MRVLLVGDEESKYLWDHYRPDMIGRIDLILSTGDLKAEYLEFLVTMLSCPCYYVHGNHDEKYIKNPPGGCDSAEDTVVRFNGLRIMGLGGCAAYKKAEFHYTERQMSRRARRLRFKLLRSGGVDIILTHAPAAGYEHTDSFAHRGFDVFNRLIDRYHPAYFIHSHVHLSYGANIPVKSRRGSTTIINACGWQVLELEDR